VRRLWIAATNGEGSFIASVFSELSIADQSMVRRRSSSERFSSHRAWRDGARSETLILQLRFNDHDEGDCK